VVLVDDSVPFINAVIRFLQGRYSGEVVVIGTATSGEGALYQAATLRPQIIVIDLRMPGMTGFEVIPRLRSMFPETGIIALTHLDDEENRRRALAAGADEFVSKIATGTDLLPAIRRVSKRQSARDADDPRVEE
jgi:DNA-binding NarL/FixJ family response regulator